MELPTWAFWVLVLFILALYVVGAIVAIHFIVKWW